MQGFPHPAISPSLGQLAGPVAGTYPPPFPTGGPPSIMPMPGPAALGPLGPQGSIGTGGVAGVGINPVSAVPPPVVAGGPHSLPNLPPCPLPQGFPNPFALPTVREPAPDPSLQPFAPGTTTIIGPQGNLPGLGGAGLPPGVPLLPPEVLAQLPPGMVAQLTGQQPPTPQALPTPPAATPQPAGSPSPPAPAPVWSSLAWQLLSTDAVRQVVGEELGRLMGGEERIGVVRLATDLLLSPELQNAFRAVASGSLQQVPFASLFGERVKEALIAEGYLKAPAG